MNATEAGPNPRWSAGEILVWVVLLLVAFSVFVRDFPGSGHPVPKDFAQYYVAGMVLARGEPDALYFTDLYRGLTTKRFPESRFAQIAAEAGIVDTSYYIYPPWVGLLYLPLTVLSPYRALVIVYLLNWVLVLLSCFLIARSLPGWGAMAAAAAFTALAVSFPFSHGMRAGQASIAVLFLVTLFGRALWRKRETEAGIWLAVLTGIKIFPVLFVLYLAVLRRWRALAAFAAAGVVLLGISLAAAGFDAHLRYLRLVREYAGYSTTLISNQSVTGFLMRLTNDTDPTKWSVLPIPAGVGWAARWITLAWLGVTLWITERLRRQGGPWWEPLAFSLSVIWVFTSAANVWIHHLVVLALPGAVAAAWAGSRSRSPGGWFLFWGAAWAVFVAFEVIYRLPSGRLPSVVPALLGSAPLAGAVLLYLLLWRMACRERSRSTPIFAPPAETGSFQ